MGLSSGARLGPYEILSPLGAGGMGEVFRARDTRLDRTVAIKVLPDSLSCDPEFRARFQREARTIAQLNHPHICPIYDVGEEGGTAFLVMKYLQGETLADRLRTGPLDTEQALRYAIQVADALDQAHRLGIVHRDLKPANILLAGAGVTLLDFGLAKTRTNAVVQPSAATSTAAAPYLTASGTILGTVQYMAPEQLEGKEADARTDIFALGAVLHEMLTGRRAFEGDSQAGIIAAIMQADPPPLATIDPAIRPLIQHVVTRCVAKRPDDRWQTASDLVRELQWVADQSRQSRQTPSDTPFWRRAAFIATAIAALLVIVVAYLATRRSSSNHERAFVQTPITVSISAPEGRRLTAVQIALSADGTNITYIGLAGQNRQVWTYSLATADSRLLADIPDAMFPFWSPDGRFVAFFTNGSLVRIPASGGPIQNLATASSYSSGTWSEKSVVLLGSAEGPGIFRVSSNGGIPTRVTTLDSSREELQHVHPRFLPGGDRFLYLARSRKPEYTGVYVRSLDRDDSKFLVKTTSHAEYVEPGYLLFVRDSALLAQRFDLSRLELEGEPVPVIQDVNVNVDNGQSGFSVSSDGSIVYHAGEIPATLKWLDRHGAILTTLAPQAVFREVELSPDYTTALVRIMPKETTLVGDLWSVDLTREVSSRLTLGAAALNARWTPGGEEVLFDSSRPGGNSGIYRKRADGTGTEELVWKTPGWLADVSRDGQRLLIEEGPTCTVVEPGKHPAVTTPVATLAAPSAAIGLPFAASISSNSCGRFSPDSRFIAYTLEEAGRPDVYVVPFPEGRPRIQVSSAGGREPRWRPDGRELFYLSSAGALMSVTLTHDGALRASAPKELFRGGAMTSGPSPSYSVASDGQRFLVVDPAGDPHTDHYTVIAHWSETLKR